MTNQKLYLRRTVMKNITIVLLLVCGMFLSLPARGAVTITPSIVQLPTAAGEDLAFDFVVVNPDGISAISFQTTVSLTGPGTLTFDGPGSEAVSSDTDYWVYDNSVGAGARDLGGNLYDFGDGADNPASEALFAGDIVARYVFEWDGTIGDYIFSMDLSNTTANSVFNAVTWNLDALALDPGELTPGGDDWFTVSLIPEPATLALLGLGGILLRKRSS